jgi:hypothetical protein
MRMKSGIGLALAASILFVVLIIPFANSPVLYDVQTSARTSHHTNPEVFGSEQTTKSDAVFGDMQELLDANEQIIHYIRARNFIAAIHEYEKYDEKTQQFNTLTTNLGLVESDIGTFADENVQNREIVFDIFIGSIRAEQLQNLEEMYRDQGDQAKADAAKEERRQTYEALSAKKEDLIGVHRSLAEVSAHYQINDEAHLESIRSYNAYLNELYYSLTGEVPEGSEDIAILPAEDAAEDEIGVSDMLSYIEANRDRIRIGFQLSPEHGMYGDQIQITGRLRGTDIANRVINIYIDNQNWATATTSESGTFEVAAPVAKNTPGVHAVYCYSGASYSDIQLFSVESSGSTLTLELEKEPLSNNFICKGMLLAGDTPVSSAPVELYVNNARKAQITTSEDGSYETVLTLPTGESMVHTMFQGQFRGFPIDPSRSNPISVKAGHNMALVRGFLFLAGAFIIILVGIHLIFPGTFRRARGATGGPGTQDSMKLPHATRPEPEHVKPEISPGIAFDDFLARAQNNDWLNAIQVLYISLKEVLIAKRLLPRRRSLTHREVFRTCEHNEKSEFLSAFMEAYEKIYYGRIFPERHEPEAIAASWKSFLSTLGDDDQ